jgi:hypothetical protein
MAQIPTKLGLSLNGSTVAMNDKAPEAAIRKGDHEASAIARASTHRPQQQRESTKLPVL